MPLVVFSGQARAENELLRGKKIPRWLSSPFTGKSLGAGDVLHCMTWNQHKSSPARWYTDLEMNHVRFCVGPSVTFPSDWAGVQNIYRLSNARVTDGAIVSVKDAVAVSSIPDGYAIAADLGSKFDPWAYIGRRVWLQGALTPRRLWERYCELRLVGVEVVGVLLSPLQMVRRASIVVGGDLRTHHVRGWFEDERLKFSLRRIQEFWRAAEALYDS